MDGGTWSTIGLGQCETLVNMTHGINQQRMRFRSDNITIFSSTLTGINDTGDQSQVVPL